MPNSGLKILATTILAFLAMNSSAQAETFLDRCLAGTSILQSKMVCSYQLDLEATSKISFTLSKGELIEVSGTGSFARAKKRFTVERVRHYPMRVTAIGPVRESVVFLAKSKT